MRAFVICAADEFLFPRKSRRRLNLPSLVKAALETWKDAAIGFRFRRTTGNGFQS
jgi:hypothetical protein